MKRQRLLSIAAIAALSLATGFTACSFGKSLHAPAPVTDTRTSDLLARDLAALAPQRPGHPDLYVLAVAGDGSEAVFRNEVLHLQNLAGQRLDAAGRVIVLANHAPQPWLRPLPPATRATLASALAGIGATMARDEDLLLLYLSTHGTEDHELLLRREGEEDRFLTPSQLREALDASGIRHRVLVISACYSGGFVRALRDPDTLVLTAAHRERSSFGCGHDSAATFFGRAWLVDGLNATVDFIAAFEQATRAIEQREMAERLEPSRPQINRGENIAAKLAAWRKAFSPGPPLPYPYEEPAEAEDPASEVTPPLLPADSSPRR